MIVFINKLDREGKEPLTLIDEIEQTLQMQCYPLTWPLGIGDRFRGIYNRLTKEIMIYDQRREGDEVADDAVVRDVGVVVQRAGQNVRQNRRIVVGRTLDPLRRRFVAHHEARVVIANLLDVCDPQAQLLLNEDNVRDLAGQKCPAGADIATRP